MLAALFARKHTDRTFPPEACSVGAWRGLSLEQVERQTYWARAAEIYDLGAGGRLFQDAAFRVRDITQGNLGNCWLIAAFMCVAERAPGLIQEAFVTPRSLTGKWKVRLFDRLAEQWVVVTIDDHIPLLKGSHRPLFARSKGADLWVVLLEKAFAKFCGGYDQLDSGHTAWALSALTGAPVFRLKRYDFAEGAWRRQEPTLSLIHI